MGPLDGAGAALAEVDGEGEAGRTGADVDHGTSGEVQGLESEREVGEESSAPDHVGHGGVDEDRPEHEEPRDGGVPYALGAGSQDDPGGDEPEHHLEDGELHVGDDRTIRDDGIGQPVEEHVVESSDQRVALGEREGVADGDPGDAHDGHGEEGLGDDRRHALLPQHAAVEQGDTGGHDENEDGTDRHPRDVGVVLGHLAGHVVGGDGGCGRQDGDRRCDEDHRRNYCLSRTHDIPQSSN